MANQRSERENSLFLSLREVQNIVEERVREEEQEARDRQEAEVRAREDAIRRAKEEEEGRIRAVEEAARAEQEARERQARQDELRLEEAERRARIEAQARLEEARIRAEAHAIANRPMPWKLIIGITTGLLVISGSAIALVVKHQREVQAELKAQDEARVVADRKSFEDERKAREAEGLQLAAQVAKLDKELTQARTAAEKKALAEQQHNARIQMEKAAAAAKVAAKNAKIRENKAKLDKCLKNPDDPLCGL